MATWSALLNARALDAVHLIASDGVGHPNCAPDAAHLAWRPPHWTWRSHGGPIGHGGRRRASLNRSPVCRWGWHKSCGPHRVWWTWVLVQTYRIPVFACPPPPSLPSLPLPDHRGPSDRPRSIACRRGRGPWCGGCLDGSWPSSGRAQCCASGRCAAQI